MPRKAKYSDGAKVQAQSSLEPESVMKEDFHYVAFYIFCIKTAIL
ncbi:hypothetical protein [Lentibacillus sp. Marseille-P4043]|nr:hypothetical protein [Lentibacillus sp. Marseille-P4043]